MKKTVLLLTLALCITFSASSIANTPLIFGKWKIEQVQLNNTVSDFAAGQEMFFEGNGLLYWATGDATIQSKNQRLYRFDERLGEVLVREGYVYERYLVRSLPDGKLELENEDGIVVTLSRLGNN